MPQIAISYGPTQPSIADQLKEQGCEIDHPERYEMSRNSILQLSTVHVLTDAMTQKCFKRLHNEVIKYSREIKKDDKAV